jgi:hypothetical protein
MASEQMEWNQTPGLFDVFDIIPPIPLQPLPRAGPPQIKNISIAIMHCQNFSHSQRNRNVCGPNCESFFIAFTQNAFNDVMCAPSPASGSPGRSV